MGGAVLVLDSDLVARAAASGYHLTARSLERYRYRGLLPKLAPTGLGRGRGQAWGYIDDPSEQLMALLELRSQKLSFSECAVRLWLKCFPIAGKHLRRHLRSALKDLRKLLQYSPEQAGHKITDQMRRLKRSRKRWVARWNAAAYDKMFNFGGALIGGLEQSDAKTRADYNEVTAHYLGWNQEERALLKQLGEDPDLWQESIPKILRLVGDIFDAPDSDLIEARTIHEPLLAIVTKAHELQLIAPNPVTSLLCKGFALASFESSAGFALAYGLLRMTRTFEMPVDWMENIKGFREIIESTIERMQNAETSTASEIAAVG